MRTLSAHLAAFAVFTLCSAASAESKPAADPTTASKKVKKAADGTADNHAASSVDIKTTAADGSTTERKDNIRIGKDGVTESKSVTETKSPDGSVRESSRKVKRNKDGSGTTKTESDVKSADGSTVQKTTIVTRRADGSARVKTATTTETP